MRAFLLQGCTWVHCKLAEKYRHQRDVNAMRKAYGSKGGKARMANLNQPNFVANATSDFKQLPNNINIKGKNATCPPSLAGISLDSASPYEEDLHNDILDFETGEFLGNTDD